MGSWGCGMQANDTALDYISPLENRSLKTFKAGLALARIFRNAELCGSHDKNWAVLGVADWIMDRVPAKNLKAVRPIIDRALRGERTEGKLKGWKNPQERKDALSRFQARLDGKKIDKDKLMGDNAGLLVRICMGVKNGRPASRKKGNAANSGRRRDQRKSAQCLSR